METVVKDINTLEMIMAFPELQYDARLEKMGLIQREVLGRT